MIYKKVDHVTVNPICLGGGADLPPVLVFAILFKFGEHLGPITS